MNSNDMQQVRARRAALRALLDEHEGCVPGLRSAPEGLRFPCGVVVAEQNCDSIAEANRHHLATVIEREVRDMLKVNP